MEIFGRLEADEARLDDGETVREMDGARRCEVAMMGG